MKESDTEGITSHCGPESCECSGNGASEALTGEPSRHGIELRKLINTRTPTLSFAGEGYMGRGVLVSPGPVWRGLRPGACWDAIRAENGIPGKHPVVRQDRVVKSKETRPR